MYAGVSCMCMCSGIAQWGEHLPTTNVAGVDSRIGDICGLSSLLVLALALRDFSPGTLVFSSPRKPTFLMSNLTLRATLINLELASGATLSKHCFFLSYCCMCQRKYWIVLYQELDGDNMSVQHH